MMACSMGAFFKETVTSSYLIDFINSLVCKAKIENISSLELIGVCDSRIGGHKQLVFSKSDIYSKYLNLTDSFVITDKAPEGSIQGTNLFCVVEDPRAVFIDVLEWLMDTVGIEAHWCGYTTEAVVSGEAKIANSAVIEAGVEVGAGSVVCAGAVIKQGSRIGKNTIIRENVVIGSDGVTAYRATDGRLLKFPHVSGVYIGNNTEIGANTVVAGGILSTTFIGDNVVMGNLCNIGHGAVVEDNTWMSVGALLGGHTTIQAGATVAMGVSVRDNLVIGANASLGMGSVVVKNVEPNHSMFGNPAKRMVGLKAGPKR